MSSKRVGFVWLLALLVLSACAPGETTRTAPPAREIEREARKTPGTRISVYYSPDEKVVEAIVRQIGQAKKAVDVAMYTFTSEPLAKALVAAEKRGVRVRVVMDKTMRTARYSRAADLHAAGVLVAFDREHRIMHDKFAVIDSDTLVTGSLNWTKNGPAENAENTLIIRNNRYLAAKYRARFVMLLADAEGYEAAP